MHFMSNAQKHFERKMEHNTLKSTRRPDKRHYRDVKKQNDWLRQNMFDAMANYRYCSRCITNAFGVSCQRLARQHNVKKRQATQLIVEMRKSNVEEQSLGKYAAMPATCIYGVVEVARE